MTRVQGIVIILVLISLSLISYHVWPKSFALNNSSREQPHLILKGQRINLLLARTETERMQGLSNHEPLPENIGMLFIFTQPVTGPFWMKDMLFPLDMIWINRQRVVAISRNIPPPAATEGTPQVVEAQVSYTHVLEMTGGWSDQHQLTINETVEFHL